MKKLMFATRAVVIAAAGVARGAPRQINIADMYTAQPMCRQKQGRLHESRCGQLNE